MVLIENLKVHVSLGPVHIKIAKLENNLKLLLTHILFLKFCSTAKEFIVNNFTKNRRKILKLNWGVYRCLNFYYKSEKNY